LQIYVSILSKQNLS